MLVRPRVSFVVLSYNNARFLGQTLESIRRQTVQDYEVILVDDASTDNSMEVAEVFATID